MGFNLCGLKRSDRRHGELTQIMVTQGLTLMVAGMATVLLFLWIMVLVMQATACFFRKYAHVFADPEPEQSHLGQLTRDDSIDIAIAVAAVRHLHR